MEKSNYSFNGICPIIFVIVTLITFSIIYQARIDSSSISKDIEDKDIVKYFKERVSQHLPKDSEVVEMLNHAYCIVRIKDWHFLYKVDNLNCISFTQINYKE